MPDVLELIVLLKILKEWLQFSAVAVSLNTISYTTTTTTTNTTTATLDVHDKYHDNYLQYSHHR